MKERVSKLPFGSGVNHRKNTTKFYNSVCLNGHNLEQAQKQAETQELKILDLLRKHPTESFTKAEIKEKLVLKAKISNKTPESSISRALSNLKNEGRVLKLEKFREGSLGKPNHLWQIKPEPIAAGSQLDLF